MQGQPWSADIPHTLEHKDLAEAIVSALLKSPNPSPVGPDACGSTRLAEITKARNEFLMRARGKVATRRAARMETRFLEFLKLQKWHETQEVTLEDPDDHVASCEGRHRKG